MRVISGKYRGRRLLSPADSRVRPTTDRIKETMFNILASRGGLYGAVLDLFSGSGALGIEALSRGAASAVFIDKDPDSIRLTKKNLAVCGISGAEVYNTDYRVACEKLTGRAFDFIFADPPYALRIEPLILDCIGRCGLLAENGTIIIEHDSKNDLLKSAESYIIDTRVCGNTTLSFLRREV